MSESNPGALLATLLQLMRRARDCDGEDALNFVIVNETIRLLPYRQAALWQQGLPGRVIALSGLPETDPSAPYVQWLGALFRHVLEEGPAEPVFRVEACDLPAAIAAEWGNWLPPCGLCVRMQHARQAAPVTLLLAREEAWSQQEQALIGELAHAWGHARAGFAPRQRWGETLLSMLRPGKRQRRLLLALLLIACIPLRLSVLARGEVSAETPFLIRAPLNGVIDRIDVEPNQRVTQGLPLFSLDVTVLSGQNELANTAREAALEAFRQSSQLAVTDDRGKLEMSLDRARLEEKTIEADISAQQLEQARIKAPRDGIIIFSDRNDWMGRAVATGEKVMTLADPDHVELVAFLPAAEAIEVHPGSAVTLYPNAAPTESWEAVVTRVAYRAEITEDGILAYRIHAAFKNTHPKPRIGQMGTARVYGTRVPLIYYVFRRPLSALRQWLGW